MIQGKGIMFIDMEWEQVKIRPSVNDRIVEIAAKKLDAKSKFFRWIKYSKPIRKQTCRFLNIKQTKIDTGVSLEKAMDDLNKYALDIGQIVVWSQDTRVKLLDLISRYKCKNMSKKIVAFQDVFSEIVGITNNVSFEVALISTNSTYNQKHMHNAGFDVRCLKDLYIRITSEYEKNNIMLQRDLICANARSNIYHTDNCSYLKKSISEKKSLSYKDVIGHAPCKRCIGSLSPLNIELKSQDEISKIKGVLNCKGKSVDSKMMNEIAKYYGLSTFGGPNIVTVSTGYSFWQVHFNKGYAVKLKHENYSNRNRTIIRFHDHKKFPKDIYSLFEYINEHDKKSNIEPIAEAFERKQKLKDKKKKLQKSRKMIEYDEWERYYDAK